jgi:hypothetical protein
VVAVKVVVVQRTGEIFDIDEPVALGGAEIASSCVEVDVDPDRGVAIGRAIDVIPTVDGVAAAATLDEVVAAPAADRVAAVVAVDLVMARDAIGVGVVEAVVSIPRQSRGL